MQCEKCFKENKCRFPNTTKMDSASIQNVTIKVEEKIMNSGNVINIYDQKGIPSEVNGEPFVQTEIPLYGAGKLGTYCPGNGQDAAVKL